MATGTVANCESANEMARKQNFSKNVHVARTLSAPFTARLASNEPWRLFAYLHVLLLVHIHFGNGILLSFGFQALRQLGNREPCSSAFYVLL